MAGIALYNTWSMYFLYFLGVIFLCPNILMPFTSSSLFLQFTSVHATSSRWDLGQGFLGEHATSCFSPRSRPALVSTCALGHYPEQTGDQEAFPGWKARGWALRCYNRVQHPWCHQRYNLRGRTFVDSCPDVNLKQMLRFGFLLHWLVNLSVAGSSILR